MRNKLRAILLALSLIFGGVIGSTSPSLAATPYLECVYSPSVSSRTTYGQAICFRHNVTAPVSFRVRVTCQYFSGVSYIHYYMWGGWKAADAGIWSLAYCLDHHLKSDRYTVGPDIVIHSWVEYSGPVSFVNGGF